MYRSLDDIRGVSKVTHGFHFFLKNAIYDIGGCNLEDGMYVNQEFFSCVEIQFHECLLAVSLNYVH